MGLSNGQVPATRVSFSFSTIAAADSAAGYLEHRTAGVLMNSPARSLRPVVCNRTEIASHCGMSTWSRHSTTVRATADRVEGPYTHAETIIGTESHNAIYAYSPTDKIHLVYGIFQGTWPASCNPPPHCTDGTTPGGKGLHPPRPPLYPNSKCYTAYLTVACSNSPRQIV